MYNFHDGYVERAIQVNEKNAAMDMRPDLRRDLLRQKENAQENIARVDMLLLLLDKNPDVEQILKLLGRG